jgi:diacylglycerol kinase family enzyme
MMPIPTAVAVARAAQQRGYRRRSMELLLVVNSSASSVTARTRVVIQKALSADHRVTLAETSRRGHATRLAQGAARDGVDVVVVLGGDGTLNEAANGLAGSTTALAPLPGGSTNVFCRTLGLADDPVEATGALLESLARRSIRRVGLGCANDRYFLFHVGMGFDAAVVQQVERRSELKRWASHALFVWAAIDTAARHYDRSRPRLAVHHSDGRVVDDGYVAVVFNTTPYTYLGTVPIHVAPDAGLDHEGLVAVTVRTLRFPTIAALLISALRRRRRFARHPLVDYRTGVEELRVTGHGPFPYQLDGDYLGEVESLRFRYVPEALALVIPEAGAR